MNFLCMLRTRCVLDYFTSSPLSNLPPQQD